MFASSSLALPMLSNHQEGTKQTIALDQLLKAKEKDEVKALIKKFVEKEQMIDIAILYYILVHQQLMDECPMVTFCNALALFGSTDIVRG